MSGANATSHTSAGRSTYTSSFTSPMGDRHTSPVPSLPWWGSNRIDWVSLHKRYQHRQAACTFSASRAPVTATTSGMPWRACLGASRRSASGLGLRAESQADDRAFLATGHPDAEKRDEETPSAQHRSGRDAFDDSSAARIDPVNRAAEYAARPLPVRRTHPQQGRPLSLGKPCERKNHG